MTALPDSPSRQPNSQTGGATKSNTKTPQSKPTTPKYTKLNLRKDLFGDASIHVIGDSITHGANALNIPQNSYIGLLKQQLSQTTGSTNYGFVSIEGTMWNAAGIHQELHKVGIDTNLWKERRSGSALGTYTLFSGTEGAALPITVQRTFAYFCIYYVTSPTGGSFDVVSDGKVLATISTKGEVSGFTRSAMLSFAGVRNNSYVLRLRGDGTVAVNGVGYYNDLSAPVINNYANNGLQLQAVSDDVLSFMCKADTVIFALGYNDSHFPSSQKIFSQKIDLAIQSVNAYHSKLIVNDFCWNLPSDNFYRQELRRLATSCNGTYIDYATACPGLLAQITDTAHPSAAGHAMIAKQLLTHLTWNK